MTTNQVVQTLKQQASDPVANAVFHMWALRKRARNEVTINGLHARMKAEGFVHSKTQYEPLLKLMATLGLGKLSTDAKGRVIALREVKTTLQSLGRAVCETKSAPTLKRYQPKTKFRSLQLEHAEPVKASEETPVTRADTSITVTVDSKSMTFPIDKEVSDEEAGYLVGKFIKFATTL